MPIWPIVVAGVMVVVLAAVVLVGLGLALRAAGKPLTVTPADRELLVTTADIEPRVGSFKPVPGVEKVTKTKGLDGAIELEYVYDQSDKGMYLSTTVITDSSPSSAATTYAGLRVGHGVGFSLSADNKSKMEDREDLFSWGDESRSALITYDGKPVGNLFVTRKGRHIYSFMIVGVYFDSEEVMSDLLLPKLQQLATYSAGN
jgi:hypothetical protein